MKKKLWLAITFLACFLMLCGCGAKKEKASIADGVYTVDFDTDSSMFRLSEACHGKATLTVKDGEMNVHISLLSQKIINLYPGLASDAEKKGAILLEPTVDVVTYDDGMTEEVFGFDVPVPYLDQEFDLAILGTKGKWYDHKVSVKNPIMEKKATVTFSGGSGKAYVEPEAIIKMDGEKIFATITWSSKNYDYMIVDGEKYLNEATEGNPSVFTIPVAGFDQDITVIGDTVAMSTPHEIEYVLSFKLVE